MKKKLISLFLIGAMTTGMVAGCGSGNSNADAGNNASSDNAAVEVQRQLQTAQRVLLTVLTATNR